MTDESATQEPGLVTTGARVGEADAGPLLHIVKGNATAEEIAALVAVLASLGGSAPAPERRTPAWQAHHRKVRATLPHGPGGWRSSGLPH